jgi:HAMP domain-containing protein
VLGLQPALEVADREDLLGRLVSAGFVQMMTARRQKMLNGYLAELTARAPTLETVGVYGSNGALAFGTAVPGVDRQLLRASRSRLRAPEPRRAPDPNDAAAGAVATGGSLCRLPQGPCPGARCPRHLAPRPADSEDAGAKELESVIDANIRMIMLSKLGRMITTFLDEVAVTGAVRDLRLWDADGRSYYQAGATTGPPYLVEALRSTVPIALFSGAGHQERVVVARSLSNRAECAVCHGKASPVRGAVTVSLSTAAAAEARAAARLRTGLFMVGALGAILAILYFLLQSLLIRPIAKIADVAEQVGQGRLDVSVTRASPIGDEVIRLGSRINDMIHGLRTKLILERFVSKGAAVVAAGAGREGAVERMAGERRGAVISSRHSQLHAYSETVPPSRSWIC